MFTKTRSQLTAADCAFIASSLGMSEAECSDLVGAGGDPEIITGYLHDERLLRRSMTPPPVFLDISPQLFFYIFIYRALDRKRIADDDVVDYIAAVCVEFRSSAALWHLAAPEGGTFFYVADLLSLMAGLDDRHRHMLRKHIGDMTLFLTGFFPGYFGMRTERRGAPPIAYYEDIARTQYGTAAHDPLAEREQTSGVLYILSERFGDVRTALNDISAEYGLVSTEHRGGRAQPGPEIPPEW